MIFVGLDGTDGIFKDTIGTAGQAFPDSCDGTATGMDEFAGITSLNRTVRGSCETYTAVYCPPGSRPAFKVFKELKDGISVTGRYC
ncbi:MAG: hypothetical protein BWY45_03458 [Euryarchaeota archaeon ADurb.Bin294]|nr:MAG: hypothetical protein BWY45_03458 [Euryarchaeota archaeon ADurb.Bin294]